MHKIFKSYDSLPLFVWQQSGEQKIPFNLKVFIKQWSPRTNLIPGQLSAQSIGYGLGISNLAVVLNFWLAV